MIKFFISILVFSICYGTGDLQERMIQLSKDLQKQLNFKSISQMKKQKELSPNNTEQTSTRDADDLIGSWEEVERNSNAYITVGQDQSIQDAMTLMGMKEAEGSLTATTDDFITELKYILDLSNMEGDDNDDEDDSTYSYGPRIGALLTDLDPGSGGSVYFDDTDTDATITFVDVPKFDNLDLTHTFQIQLIYESNKVVLSYKDLSLSGSNTGDAYGGLAIGISDGSGEYDAVDFSTISEESYTYPVEAYSIENQLDLAYTKVTFSPNGDFSEYTVSQESITDLPGLYGNVISVEDDDYDFQVLSNEFLFYGEAYSQIYINNDGNIGFESGDEYCVCWFCDDGDGDCAAGYLAGQVGGVDNQDDDSEVLIMNMDLMEFFALTFEMDLNQIDVENPTVISVNSTREDGHIDDVNGIIFSESSIVELEADSMETIAATSIDTINSVLTITNLNLYDSTGAVFLTVNGSIGPGSIELQAGIETSIDFLFEDGDGEGELSLTFYDDWSGIDVELDSSYDSYGSVEYLDTSYFNWAASTDSLFLYYYDDTMSLEYMINQDTLFTQGFFDPCAEDGYNTYEDCFNDIDLPGFDELVEIDNFRIGQEVSFTSVVFTSIEPNVGVFPNQFKLYPAYPNPFNPLTTIQFDVETVSSKSVLNIYNISGKNVATLINERLKSGSYEVQWDASSFSSGVYFSELISGGKRVSQKMILLK
ncbi:T9SS type A sorting domain-containing protein [Candidatus Marinimicrobia bacterium]|nr:T9SS type A sorting domain-containing protein [Candidatus Neomarinimicrobiota bacterium]